MALDDPLLEPLKLPCGKELKCRIIKGATTEGIADEYGCATDKHVNLYRGWASNKFGIQIVGHFMIDQKHMEHCGNVVVDRDSPKTLSKAHLNTLKQLAEAGRANGSLMVVQISHCGRQSREGCSELSIGPSAIPVRIFGSDMAPLRPEPFTVEEIKGVIAKYVYTAKALKECGFDGVQIHAAHGYLPHQFLSPQANVRTDAYGGSVARRAQFLVELVDAVRAACGPAFAIGVRLSGQDFDPIGIELDHTVEVLKLLDAHGVDFAEISGGTSENLACLGGPHAMKAKMTTPTATLVLGGVALAAFASLAGFPNSTAALQLLGPISTIATFKACRAFVGVLSCFGAYRMKMNPSYGPEGWFLQDALYLKAQARPTKTRIGVVGGFHSRRGIEGAIQAGVDFVSVVSIVCVDQLAVKKMLDRESDAAFHPQRIVWKYLGLPPLVSLMTSLIPAPKSPLKLPASIGSSLRPVMAAGYMWLWCAANLCKFADGETEVPLPGTTGTPCAFTLGNAKLANDAKKLKELKPYWKKPAA